MMLVAFAAAAGQVKVTLLEVLELYVSAVIGVEI
jgi:hypothetical protein